MAVNLDSAINSQRRLIIPHGHNPAKIPISEKNECTKVQNPRRTRVRESMKVHASTLTGSIRKTLSKSAR